MEPTRAIDGADGSGTDGERGRTAPSPRISVVVPAYNESANVAPLLDALVPVLRRHGSFEILFVDDGSTDGTLEVIQRARAEHPEVGYVALSRNFGHQAALRAGLAHARGECVISMDADLQHPPALADEMIARWERGCDVVYTVRDDGAEVPFLKRTTSTLFYRALNALSEVEVQQGAADFRLLGRPVLDVLNQLDESPLFLRGMLPWLGFRQEPIVYRPAQRRHGTSKYTLHKMMRLALDGITSFSVKPLGASLVLGAFVAALAFAYSGYVLWVRFFTDSAVPGWTSVLAAVLWLGAMQLAVLGVIGLYVGRLFMQVKRRPPYVIKERSPR